MRTETEVFESGDEILDLEPMCGVDGYWFRCTHIWPSSICCLDLLHLSSEITAVTCSSCGTRYELEEIEFEE